ncbi:MAG: DUF4168 domain-containing protein [Synechococcaceae cyanobacterium SM2_3_2]|nr:DUF4168 domain-containing protein [Synechococcaceae cyanobacterium SM2_3_2]
MLKAILQAGLVALLLGSPAWAQVEPTPEDPSGAALEPSSEDPAGAEVTPMTPALSAEDVSDEQVEQLASALLQIEPMLRQASDNLAAAETDEQRQEIAASFEQEAAETVEGTGLSVDLYRQLIELANSNPQFNERVAAQLDQLQPELSTEDSATSEPAEEATPSE